MARRIRGRGAAFNPPNRYEELSREVLPPEEGEDPPGSVPTRYFTDTSRSILSRNDSPDIPFTWSINPYRGCEHGCIYCYARPSHEYLGFSAGVDFETKILVKPDAPRLLTRALGAKSWTPQVVALSGNTDPYQNVERRLRLTRRCLEVFLEYRNPVSLITKNALVVRDADILEEMARLDLVHVMLSVTSLQEDLIRIMEPRTSSPALRLRAIADLAARGIPVGVNVAPVIPGLTDEEIPAIIAEAAARGARAASYILVRLPGSVEPLFLEWLERELPARSARVLGRIRQVRSGALSDARFHTRGSGEGEIADAIASLFALSASRANLDTHWLPLSTLHFRRSAGAQRDLFER
ncbi:MAG TPA: PA0069 family radical SAM protein [Bacteroidota bacterium]|nr:PA0069 family radical SAM protein [Bacteroidota bacterium]